MKLSIPCLFLILFLNLACCDEASEGLSSLHKNGPELAPPAQVNQEGVLTSNLSALKIVSLSFEPAKRKGIYVIGAVSLSLAEKNLAMVTGIGQRSELVDDGRLTKLYSDMSPAFGMRRLPIKFFKNESQNSQLFREMKPHGLYYNFTGQPDVYLEQVSYNLPAIETSDGLSESRGGVTAIWNP